MAEMSTPRRARSVPPSYRFILASMLASVVFLAASACGGSDESEPARTSEAATTETAAGEPIPDALIGTWSTTLRPADIPADAPPELAGTKKWQLEIAESGGFEDGPVLSIVNRELGQLEGPALEVDGDRLLLKQEECAAGGDIAFYDNEYSYTLTGSKLTITTISNQCPDRVAETILTSRPWTKSAGN